jgi:site-specific DNA-cytosine methylase
MLSRNTSGGFSNSIDHAAAGYMAMQPICLMDQGGSVMNVEHDMVGTLRRETHGHEPIVAQPMVVHGTQDPCVSDIAFAQGRNNGGENVMVQSMAVRRLTPVECERLQGFPDAYTDIKSKGKATPDGPRYKALGNSMAVPVMAWIGNRIQQVESLKI